VKQLSLFEDYFELHNRRYIGNKYKLSKWIFEIIEKESSSFNTFVDLFAGTASLSAVAIKKYNNIIINDFLYSNYAIYNGFFLNEEYDEVKLNKLAKKYNSLDIKEDNYFSINFGGKYFSNKSAKLIGYIREDIEKEDLTKKEYYILLSSLIYSIDKIANTVGHYDAYFKKSKIEDNFVFKLIKPFKIEKKVTIFREDANSLAKKIEADLVYIDPPYNSRQYSRFYHLLETLTKWDKPKLYGTALKPPPENISDYCKVSAKDRFQDLIKNLKTKYIVVSYNNTYNPKSNSSKNKIELKEIEEILSNKGELKTFSIDYKHFTTGKTNFSQHKEYLFVTKVNNG
jgi:adenine-specific DNA-methyltransferase